MPWPLPVEGEATFKLPGDMATHGIASPAAFDAAARSSGGLVSAHPSAVIAFEQFRMTRPRLFLIVSACDETLLGRSGATHQHAGV